MHRAVQTLIIGGVLLTAAACGTASNRDTSTPQVGQSAAAAAPDAAQAATKTACEDLGKVFDKNMAPFAEALTKSVASQKDADRQQAQKALKTFGTAVLDATKASTDAQLRADGKQTADQLQAKSADAAFFKKIVSGEDVNRVLGPTLKEWLSP